MSPRMTKMFGVQLHLNIINVTYLNFIMQGQWTVEIGRQYTGFKISANTVLNMISV